ncbi:MAG: nucleoside triphosphate pyrophosphatase [Planctomycetia bacterium]|nr:nucleoside triphosphate pyrophosphatase [Planctomycetia bacterium]
MRPFHRRKIILASRSPRRQELLRRAGILFQAIPADDGVETAFNAEKFHSPAEFVCHEARLKAENVARRFPREDIVVIACDTIAVCDGEILGKPDDKNDARRMLSLLSGTQHEVISGLCLWNPAFEDEILLESVVTRLSMTPLSDELLEAYLESGRWQGKAGAFGYQDGNDWIRVVEGSESNVVGLPMERLLDILTPDENWI